MKRNAKLRIALLAGLTAAGCENLGLYDAGAAEEARQNPPSALVSAVIQPAPMDDGRQLVVGGRLWIASGRPTSLDPQDVRPIGSANGRTVHARAWDRPPYDELFTATDDERWLAYRPVPGGDVPAGSAHAPAHPEGAETGTDADRASGDEH